METQTPAIDEDEHFTAQDDEYNDEDRIDTIEKLNSAPRQKYSLASGSDGSDQDKLDRESIDRSL